jgi:hypothetical protein
VGVGVVIGVVGVSNAIKWLLEHYAKPTLGALLGLLFGAVVGLWPFQQPVAPQLGEVLKGQVVTVANAETFDREDWKLQRFSPKTGQAGTSLGLIAIGLVGTLAIARLGADDDSPVND